jgi:hypothetical protein
MFASVHLKSRIYNFIGFGNIAQWVKNKVASEYPSLALQLIYVLDVE